MVGCEGPLSPSLSALGRAVSLCNASFLLPGDPASRRRRRDESEGAERSGCARKEMHLACWRSVGLGRVHVLVRGKSEINYCLPSVGLRGTASETILVGFVVLSLKLLIFSRSFVYARVQERTEARSYPNPSSLPVLSPCERQST